MSGKKLGVASGEPIASHVAVDKHACCGLGWNTRGWLRLAACTLGLFVVWGWLLPAIGSHGEVRKSIETMNALGINPGAIFYTDVFQSRAAGSATDLLTRGDD